jgi:hypothetical protein
VTEAVLPLHFHASSPSLAPQSSTDEQSSCTGVFPAIQQHASCINAWLRLLSALPLPSSTVVAVAFTKVLLATFLATFILLLLKPSCNTTSQVDLLPAHVFLDLLPPLLHLPTDGMPVSLFATSAKANSQVMRTPHTSHLSSHTSQVHRVFHDVAAIVLRRRQSISASPSPGASVIRSHGSISNPTRPAALVPTPLPERDHMLDSSDNLRTASSFHTDREAEGITAVGDICCFEVDIMHLRPLSV